MNVESMANSAMRGVIPRVAGKWRADLVAFASILTICNLPLLLGRSTSSLSFQSDAVAGGEWWRLLSHPFVHVSWYHLLLDGTAFFSLYMSLLPGQPWRRLLCVVASAAGSLLMAVWFSPLIATHGLCGLSGVAHGLMAASALETLGESGVDRDSRKIAAASLLVVIGKCVFEFIMGTPFFAILHFGLLGTPIVECHAGGVVGGIAALLLSRRNGTSSKTSHTKGGLQTDPIG